MTETTLPRAGPFLRARTLPGDALVAGSSPFLSRAALGPADQAIARRIYKDAWALDERCSRGRNRALRPRLAAVSTASLSRRSRTTGQGSRAFAQAADLRSVHPASQRPTRCGSALPCDRRGSGRARIMTLLEAIALIESRWRAAW